MTVRTAGCAAAILALLGTASLARRSDGPPYSPADSLATMQLEDGYRIEVVASEPDVQSPVAMDIDERGRLFVAEMPGYPLDTRPTGRIKVLDDTDGDGRYDRSRVFADGLVLPTGVMRWKRGVLVTSAPDLLYLEDRDDDGRADTRQVIITGFARTNPQHMVNGPVYGLDNWIYLAHEGPAEAVIYKDLFGDRGSPLRWPDHPERPELPTLRSGVRLRPDAGLLERLAGNSQYGHGFDAWGRYFTNDNANHARHEVIEAAWLARNPDLRLDSAMADIPDHGEAAQVFPITKRPTFELLTESGEFTSACAITPYTGGAFPEKDGPSLFVAEPVHNLVHRDVLSPDGATFVARRATEGREFLAAGDSWFRPVFLYVGPDGSLFIVDYYRPRIEHPEWTSSDLQKDRSPLYVGQDRGRIYRVSALNAPRTSEPVPDLSRASDGALVRALEAPGAWMRRTAQRLLVDRRSRDAVEPLRALAGSSSSALARVHALWTLDGLGALDEQSIERALRDDTAGVRENAVRLAETRLRESPTPASRLVDMTGDPDARVRFLVLGALGWIDSDEARAARSRLLFSQIDDVWMQRAALSAGSDQSAALFEAAMRPGSEVLSRQTDARAAFVRQLASITGARQRADEIRRAIASVAPESETPPRSAEWPAEAGASGAWWRAAVLEGLAQGARDGDSAAEVLAHSRAALLALQRDDDASVRAGALDLLRLAGPGQDAAWREAVQQAIELAQQRGADADRRADAIALAALDHPEQRAEWFAGFVSPHEPERVQVAAVLALGRFDPKALQARGKQQRGGAGSSRLGPLSSSRDLGQFLLARWPELTPGVRSHAADVLLDDSVRARLLVDALRDGRVQAWSLGFWQKQALVLYSDPEIRRDARAVLEEDPRQRGVTVKRYAAALDLEGNPERGAQVFTRICAVCHRLEGKGGDLGPDLGTVRHRPPLNLLSDILLPSQSIAQHYETYVVERTDGRTEAGVLSAETPNAITLKQGGGRDVVIRRADIRKMSVSPRSTMPADLDKAISPDEMADLLAYIRGQ